ncbi:MAG: acyloxyacyl hydrolase [Chthoniobacteraceae bacterium]|nr:acyloxyacyl hydrolase [Chthoniobacteraceae bacterium]
MRISRAMMSSSFLKSLPFFALCLLGCSSTFAGPASLLAPAAPPDDGPFAKGALELSLSGGFLYSPICATKGRPIFAYGQGDLSLGWMLSDPAPLLGWNALRGNWEALANVFGAGVTRGPSGFLGGGRALLRYNFVQPGSKWVPFFQVGAGVLGDTVYEDHTQRLIGSGFEFTLVADAGLRYCFTPRWAAVLLADFEHISNANTASRNLGVNAVGGTVGVSWFF